MFAGLVRRFSVIGWLRYYLLDRNYNQTVRVLLVGLCLLMTLLSAALFRNSVINNNYIPGFMPVVLVLMIMIVVFVYRYLEAMPIIILCTTMLLADGIPTGTGTKLTFTFLLLYLSFAIWLFRMLVVQRSFKEIRPALSNMPIVAFIVVVIISLIWSTAFVDKQVSYLFGEKLFPRLMTGAVLIISALTYLLYANQIRSVSAIRFFVWWFIALGLIFGVIRVADISLPLINFKGQFPAWVIAFCSGQLFFNRNLKWYHRGILGLICAIWLYIQLGLGLTWLSGWVPLVLIFGFTMLIYSRKLFFGVCAVMAVVMLLNWNFVTTTFNAENQESGHTRGDALGEAVQLTSRHILFGTGPAGYAFYFATYLGPVGFTHNNYADIFTQTGSVGFIIFISIWVTALITAVRTYRVVPKNGFLHGAAIALLASSITVFLVMGLGDWVTPFTYTQTLAGIDYTIWSWMIAGLNVALFYIQKNALPDTAVTDGVYA